MGIEVIEDNDKNEKKEKKTNYIKRYENKTFWK